MVVFVVVVVVMVIIVVVLLGISDPSKAAKESTSGSIYTSSGASAISAPFWLQ